MIKYKNIINNFIGSRFFLLLKFIGKMIFVILFLQTNIVQIYADEVSTNDFNLTEEEKKWISEHPVLKASNELTWAPLDFVENGEALGFSVDYLNLVADKFGFKIEYVNGYSWLELLELLEQKEIDIKVVLFVWTGWQRS